MADKDVKKFVRELERQGWRVMHRRGGHYFAYAPDGVGTLTLATTPSSPHWKRQALRYARQYGFKG